LNRNLKFILGAIGILLFAYSLWYFRTIVAYVAIATVISFIGEPVVRLQRSISIRGRRLPSWFASLTTLASFFVILVMIFRLFAPLVATQAQTLSTIDYQLVGAFISEQFADILAFLKPYNLSGDERTNEAYIVQHLQSLVELGDLGALINNFIGFIGSAVIGVFSVLFISFFFLRDAHMVGRILRGATPDRHTERINNILDRTRRLLTRYFSGLLLQVTTVTLLVTAGLSVVGVHNAFLIGVVAGLLNLIPYIGPIIGASIGIFIALTTSPEIASGANLTSLALKTAAIFATVQLLDNIVFQPLIFSNSVNAHPLEIFIVISLAGTLAGIGGMILAIPAYTLFRIVAKEFLSGFKVIQTITKNLDKA
jgi:predicted PurR-regulated permease PerM